MLWWESHNNLFSSYRTEICQVFISSFLRYLNGFYILWKRSAMFVKKLRTSASSWKMFNLVPHKFKFPSLFHRDLFCCCRCSQIHASVYAFVFAADHLSLFLKRVRGVHAAALTQLSNFFKKLISKTKIWTFFVIYMSRIWPPRVQIWDLYAEFSGHIRKAGLSSLLKLNYKIIQKSS